MISPVSKTRAFGTGEFSVWRAESRKSWQESAPAPPGATPASGPPASCAMGIGLRLPSRRLRGPARHSAPALCAPPSPRPPPSMASCCEIRRRVAESGPSPRALALWCQTSPKICQAAKIGRLLRTLLPSPQGFGALEGTLGCDPLHCRWSQIMWASLTSPRAPLTRPPLSGRSLQSGASARLPT